MPLNEEKDKFMLVAKRILKENLSTVPTTLITYKNDIIEAYCIFVIYCNEKSKLNLNSSDKDTLFKARNYIYEKFEECLIALKCTYNLSQNLLDLPNPDTIRIPSLEEDPEDLNKTILDDSYISTHDSSIENPNPDEIQAETLQNKNLIMSTELTTAELLKLASSHINKTYSGDPLGLKSFIDSVELLETLATSNTLKTFLASFVKTKIDGRAREFIVDTDNTLLLIKNALKANIKPDSSKVIEGRLLALHLTSTNQQDFTDKAEKLTDALRRSLIIEGMTIDKANEITVEKTVELCRHNTRSDLVKSVLEATPFTNPKDVLAKLVTQVTKVRQEHQILAYKAQFNQKANPNMKNGKNNSNSKPFLNNRPNNQHQNNRNNSFHGNFRNNNPRQNSNNWNRSNNNFNQNGPRNQNNNNNYGNQNRNGNFNRNVRVFTNSGNGVFPHQQPLGEHQPQDHDSPIRS